MITSNFSGYKIIFAAFFCLLSGSLSAQSPVAVYLKNNSVDITHDVTENKILDKEFFNHHIFLLGESHGVQKPQEIDFNFFKLLNNKSGVHTYVAEIDFAKAYFLNRYLATGNDKLIDTVFADWIRQDAQWANKDFQDKIRKIRSLNQTLPAKSKISFAGIDQVQNPVLVADYFDALFQTKPFLPYQPRFKELNGLLRSRAADSLVTEAAAKLLAELNSSKINLNNRADELTLRYALQNCVQVSAKSREKVLFENFKYYYQNLNWKNEKLYGFWGFFHVLQAKTNVGKATPFATMLIDDPELNLKGKIASVGFMYVGSRMAIPTAFIPEQWQEKGKHYSAVDKFNYDGPMTTFGFIDVFKAATQPGTTTLIRMDGNDSPFMTQPIVVKYNAFMPTAQRLTLDEPGKNAADYFQYVILVRDSPAVNTIVP